MKLVEFKVENYKVFKNEFSIKFDDSSISILTGRNNMGKSTLLEAVNRFFQNESKGKSITSDCFSDSAKTIIMKATFEGQFKHNPEEGELDEAAQITEKVQRIEFVKKYTLEQAPKFYDSTGSQINNSHPFKEDLSDILSNQPFYITPYMNPDDINSLIQDIYAEILKNKIEGLESIEKPSEDETKLIEEYKELQQAYPMFLRKIKSATDSILEEVSADVSNNLKHLFSNNSLEIDVRGGESSGFSAADILKSTNSSVNISNSIQRQMPLSNQGTGLQRMSLIYLIQNMIEKKLIGGEHHKLLLIDEPEAFLHPEAVRALSKSLYRIGAQMPLMISTHSPILIDLSEKHTSIQLFRINQATSTQAIELYQSKNDTFDSDDIKNMKILNYVDSYVNEFFFADQILIVEGDTEYMIFKHFAEKENVNVHIIRARGKGTIQTLMKILNQFDVKYYVLHDIDNDDLFSVSTLKSQKTMCENIYKLKKTVGDRLDNELFLSETTFEVAIGLGKLSNDKKTKVAYEIAKFEESPDEKYKEQYEKVKGLFDYIFLNKRNDSIFDNSGFYNVVSDDIYKEKFDLLIEAAERKVSETDIVKA